MSPKYPVGLPRGILFYELVAKVGDGEQASYDNFIMSHEFLTVGAFDSWNNHWQLIFTSS
ncbi:MAG: hypothetical protein KBC28_06200 [Alphaproteobacteria bacterium]|nr:hypothetical protein [Alphaproteobacteria bacterium]